MRMTQTEEEKCIEIATRLIEKGDYDDSTIAELTDLTPEEVAEIRVELRSKRNPQ